MIASILLLASLNPVPGPHAPFLQESQAGPTTVVEYFTPKRAPAYNLVQTIEQLYSSGAAIGSAIGSHVNPPKVITFGETIIVRYRDDLIAGLVGQLEKLDAQWKGEEGNAGSLMTLEYHARYATVDALRGALIPFTHPNLIRGRGGSYKVNNISYLSDRGLVIARGSVEEIAQIESVLKNIDVPQPQVQIVCYLVEGKSGDAGDGRLPQALTENLSKLVPFDSFETLAMGILRSDALARMTMEVDYADGARFELALRPKAFDASSGALSIDPCSFKLQRRIVGGEMSDQSFSTSARILANEYTVLGAVGSEPVFVVLHLTKFKN